MKAFKVRKWLAGLFACTMAVALVPAGGTLAEGETWSTLLMKDAASQVVTVAGGETAMPWVSGGQDVADGAVPPDGMGKSYDAALVFRAKHAIDQVELVGVWGDDDGVWKVESSADGSAWTALTMKPSTVLEDGLGAQGNLQKRRMLSVATEGGGAAFVRLTRLKGNALSPAFLSMDLKAVTSTEITKEATLEKQLVEVNGKMEEQEWFVEAGILNSRYPKDAAGTNADAQLVYSSTQDIVNFELLAVTVAEANMTIDKFLKFEASADGQKWDPVSTGSATFVKNGFHPNAGLATYVEQQSVKSGNLDDKGYRYIRVTRLKGNDSFPAITTLNVTIKGSITFRESDAVLEKEFVEVNGKMEEQEWSEEAGILNSRYPKNAAGATADAQQIYQNQEAFDNFELLAVTVAEADQTIDKFLRFEASADGQKWDPVSAGAATFVQNGFHPNPGLATYVEQQSVKSGDLSGKGYRYVRVTRLKGGDSFPAVTKLVISVKDTSEGHTVTPVTLADAISQTVTLPANCRVERPWVKSDLADTYRPTNEENGDNDRYAEVVFNAGRVVNQLYMTYSWWPDSPDFVIKASVDGQNWETVPMQDYSTLKEDIGHAGLFKLRAVYSEDLTGKKYQWVKIERPGGGYAPGLGNLLVTTDGVDTEVPMVDVTSYAPLTPEEGETVFTDSLDAYVNDKGLGNAVYAQGLFFNQSVVVHREYLHLNRSCASVQGGTEGRMIYRQDGMTRFKYSYVTAKSLEAKLNAYVSPDGFTWTPAEVTAVRDESLAASEDFQRFDATASTVPAGTRYLLLEFADTANAQSYLGMVSIAGKGEGQSLAPAPSGEEQLLTDTFEGEDDAFSPLVSDCTGLVKKDVSEVRAGAPVLVREDIVDDAYVIYKADALKWMAVETSIDHEAEEDDDQTLAFTYFVSKDGQEWSELTDYSRLMSRAADPTSTYGTIAYAALPEGTRYLKIVVPEVDNIPDSVRLMTVQLLYEQAEQPPVSDPSSDPASDDQSRGEEPGSDASTPDTGDARTGLLAAGGLAALCAGALLTMKKRTVRGK